MHAEKQMGSVCKCKKRITVIRSFIIFMLLLLAAPISAKAEDMQLYAQSAVLMDGDSGRILFGKNEQEVRAMASTTKIMTCILVLENTDPSDTAAASENAAMQPKVHLGVQKGETFYVKDLLYSLMLESHNDAAVILAEKTAGSVEGFAEKMNQKAEEIGCSDTHFVTPNGLDDEDAGGEHATTAVDLARILRYCIMQSPKRDEFLEITRTKTYEFFRCRAEETLQLLQSQCIPRYDGRGTDRKDWIYRKGRLLLCWGTGKRRQNLCGGTAWLRLAEHRSYKWTDTKKADGLCKRNIF